MEFDSSFIFILIGFAAILLLRPVWTRMVGWHFRIRHHLWIRPAILLFLVPACALAFLGYTDAGFVIVVGGGMGLLFLDQVIGARCPECESGLRCRTGRYGPSRYNCRSCGYGWTGWAWKDEPPD